MRTTPWQNTDKWHFNIDDDGDNFLSFNHCVDFLKQQYVLEIADYYPGGWNTAWLKFKWNGMQLEVLFNDFGGTELNASADITASQLEEVAEIARKLIQNLEGKIRTA